MPELAAIYALGTLATLALAVLMFYLTRRRRRSRELVNLNANLARAGLFWSDHQDQIVAWTETVEETEERASARSVLLVGAIVSLLSWLGFVFLAVLFFSLRILARSRLEQKLFSSALARASALDRTEVERLVSEAKTNS